MTSLWWRERAGGEIAELLTVVPGPPTTPGVRWVQTLVQHAHGWTIVNVTPLGPLPDAVAARLGSADRVARLGEDLDPDYEASRPAAIALVAARLRERIVAEDPFASGIVLARRAEGTLTLAPALVSDTGRPVISLEAASVFAGAKPGEVDVDLGAGAPARLPAAVLRCREDALGLLLPPLNLPAPAPAGELVTAL